MTDMHAYPIYFNGDMGNGEAIKTLVDALSQGTEKDVKADITFDFKKHGYLLSGNPFSA